VDLPPLAVEFTELWLPQAIRHANASLLVVDAADPDVLDRIEFILSALDAARLPPPTLLAANKIDLPCAAESFTALEDLYRCRFPMVTLSALTHINLDGFARAVFDILGLVRVYTKAPGKPAEFSTPFLLKRGGTVQDAARLVHKDFAEQLRYARLYHRNGGRDGLMVERTHRVEDEDILEFHI
jgi:ribosome-interacting GTPase 1